MAVKWIIKAVFSAVVALIIALYPEKAAAVLLLVLHAIWNIAVTVGEQFQVPGENKTKAASAAALFLAGPLGFSLPSSDQKDN